MAVAVNNYRGRLTILCTGNKNELSEIQQYTTEYKATMDSDEDDSDIITF